MPRRKVLVVKPDGMFSTIYTEGPLVVEKGQFGAVNLIGDGLRFSFAAGSVLEFIELQGAKE